MLNYRKAGKSNNKETYYIFDVENKIFGKTLTASNLNEETPDYDLHFGIEGNELHCLILNSLDNELMEVIELKPKWINEEILKKDHIIQVEFSIGNNKKDKNNHHVQFHIHDLPKKYKTFCLNKQKDTMILDFKNSTYDFIDLKSELTDFPGKYQEYSKDNKQYLKDKQSGILQKNAVKKELANKISNKLTNSKKTDEEKNVFISSFVKRRNPGLQAKFRKKLIEEFNHKCAICGIDDERILVASHIVALCDCKNEKGEYQIEEMFDSNNGLLLCPSHDMLFDKKLISFRSTDGKIIDKNRISDSIRNLCYLNDVQIEKTYLNKSRKKYLSKRNKRF